MKVATLTLGALLAGCALDGVTTPDSGVGASDTPNVCSSDSACPGAARCLDGICVAREGEIDTVLLTVTPLAGDSLNELLVVDVGSLAPGGIANPDPLEIVLPEPIQVQGTTQYLDTKNAICDPRMRIAFSPKGAKPTSDRGRFTTFVDTIGGAFSVDLRPGKYDYYAEPVEGAYSPCLPVYRAELDVERPGTATEPLVVPLASGGVVGYEDIPSFELSVIGEQLEGWTFKLVEPSGGRVVSNEVVLQGSGTDGAYTLHLEYHHAGRAGYDARGQWILAAPPEGSDRARLAWWRGDADLDADGKGVVQLPASDLLRTVNLTLDGTDGERQSGWVSLNSAPEAGSFVTSTAFEQQLVLGPEGVRLSLEPGRYGVFVMPDSGEMQARTYFLTVLDASEPQDLAIQLVSRARLSADVVVPVSSQSPSGLPVALDPAPTRTAEEANAERPWDVKKFFGDSSAFQPASALRGSVTTTDASGAFSVSADTGESVLSVRPPLATGLPWYVKRHISPNNSEDLGTIDLPLPLAYTGQLLGSDGEALAARIEAYVYVDLPATSGDGGVEASDESRDGEDNGPEQFDTVNENGIAIIPVGETESGPDGRFKLLLPPQLY